MPKYLDATDGLAAAMCHYFQYRGDVIPETTKGVSGWKAFAAKNPDRIKG
jgi:crossover junction endodeoxyribonuclease RuvC